MEPADKPVLSKVLIIEDSALQRELVQRLYGVSKKCFPGAISIIQADSWPTGIERIRSDAPDVVLLDLCLPPMSAKETLAALKISEDIPPIIALTENQEPEIRRICFENGCDDYTSKKEMHHSPEGLWERVYHSFLRRYYATARS